MGGREDDAVGDEGAAADVQVDVVHGPEEEKVLGLNPGFDKWSNWPNIMGLNSPLIRSFC